jgi:Arc/MetJ family transcription regulator
MKTTIEISDSILNEAKRLAAKEGTTVRAYVEQGLRRIIAERKSSGQFRLHRATFKGKGLQPGVRDATWERIRETIYQGRGG